MLSSWGDSQGIDVTARCLRIKRLNGRALYPGEKLDRFKLHHSRAKRSPTDRLSPVTLTSHPR
jgi:hypothetical protein